MYQLVGTCELECDVCVFYSTRTDYNNAQNEGTESLERKENVCEECFLTRTWSILVRRINRLCSSHPHLQVFKTLHLWTLYSLVPCHTNLYLMITHILLVCIRRYHSTCLVKLCIIYIARVVGIYYIWSKAFDNYWRCFHLYNVLDIAIFKYQD